MKKILLAILLLTGAGITAQAQKFTQPNPVHEPSRSRNEKLFNEKSAALTTALNANDLTNAQTLTTELTYMIMYRGDELTIAKAPQAKIDVMRNIGQKMKFYSTDVAGKKAEIIALLAETKAVY